MVDSAPASGTRLHFLTVRGKMMEKEGMDLKGSVLVEE